MCRLQRKDKAVVRAIPTFGDNCRRHRRKNTYLCVSVVRGSAARAADRSRFAGAAVGKTAIPDFLDAAERSARRHPLFSHPPPGDSKRFSMQKILFFLLFLFAASFASPAVAQKNVYGFRVVGSDGKSRRLKTYKGKVLLIVNTAGRCGFTPQYEGLEALYEKYAGSGLVVLAFPCNQFGGQEPGTMDEILTFCRDNYGVTFPVMQKVEVNGDGAHPLFTYLKTATGTGDIQWNFAKFLIDRKGRVVRKFGTRTTPAELEPAVVEALQ